MPALRIRNHRVLAAGLVTGAGLAVLLPSRPVVRISRLSRVVADLPRAERFYRRALDFQPVARWSRADPALACLLGLPAVAADAVLLALGGQHLQLTQFDPPGAPNPLAAANAPSFQHAAIVVSDIDAAWAQVTAYGAATPISTAGPRHLPGGLRAVKFRDPDFHPLELLQFPPSQGRPQWRTPNAPLFQGIDHSALAVTSTAASLHFYRTLLGLRVTARSLNQGPAQQALDAVAHPLIRVTQIAPADPASPRLELLDYRAPPQAAPPPPGAANDIAKDQLWLEVRNIDRLFHKLLSAGTNFVSPGLVPLDQRQAMLVRDPDGHDLLLTGFS
jgi:catechol 2,3-dioxygenase-like lactoylglutathione lyase family enzyme